MLGIGFGLVFPVFGLVFDCFLFNPVPFTFEAIGNRIVENPIHFIIFSAPLVLGTTFYYIGKAVENKEILNAKLERSNVRMKNNNDLLDTFNYHVSHDLKTVLNNQLALSKMIVKYIERKDYHKLNEIARKLVESSENGLVTVKSFLKIGEDRFVHSPQQKEGINVHEEIARTIDDNALKGTADIQIETNEFSEIKIGPKVFESIALNLITNAIKYNDKFPLIKIHLKKKGNVKQLIFEDNGIGIDLEKDKENLFKPFNRIENNMDTEGTGIGLYLVHKMVNSLDGEISVESTPGVGSRFILTFHE